MTEPVSNGDIDADLLAVRNLIAQTDKLQAKPLQTPRDPLPKQSVVDTTGARRPVQKSSSSGLKSNAKRVAKILWARIKAYRPECKSVLLTSMVLLLILKPFMVLGWVVCFVAMIVFFHFVLGSDDFWRRIAKMFKAWERVQPKQARVLKLRTYAATKKWEKMASKLPSWIAHYLRPPDLRGLLAAERRHNTALNQRLSRLQQDAAG